MQILNFSFPDSNENISISTKILTVSWWRWTPSPCPPSSSPPVCPLLFLVKQHEDGPIQHLLPTLLLPPGDPPGPPDDGSAGPGPGEAREAKQVLHRRRPVQRSHRQCVYYGGPGEEWRLGKLFQYPQVPEASKCIRPENKQGSGLWAEKFRKIKIRPKVNLPYETIILLHTKLIFPFFS